MKVNKPNYLVVHHCGGTQLNSLADTSNQTFEEINEIHRNNPLVWLGEYSSLGYAIGYHYFIDKTGKVTQGRADTDEGAHTVGKNTESLGICLAGNFDLTIPSQAQIDALKLLLLRKRDEYNIPLANIVPHRTFASKSCYGKNLSNDWARSLLVPTPSVPCTSVEVELEAEKQKVSNLQSLISSLLNWFNKK